MARMAALTTDENGIPVTKGTNFSRFCMDYCRKSSIGKARCEKCDKLGALKALKEQKPVYYFCHAHLVDFAAPIMLGGRMIGIFIGGQVLTEPPDFDKMRMIARELEVDGIVINRKEAEKRIRFFFRRGNRIRTCDLIVPNDAL